MVKSSILTWTYHVLDMPMVIIMGNGYGVLSYSVLETFLLGPAKDKSANSHV